MNYSIPQNLLSNFLTHSYFDLLEHFCQYSSSIHDQVSPPKEFMKALKSFLFIFQNNSLNTKLLQETIFKYYEPYQSASSNAVKRPFIQKRCIYPILCFGKKHLTFKNIKKSYHKTLLAVRLENNYTIWNECNISYIKLHRELVYTYFKTPSSLPTILKASNATDFVLNAWVYYIDILLATKGYDTLLTIIKSFYINPFDSSAYLLNYIDTQINTLEENPSLSSFKNKLAHLYISKEHAF